MLQPIYTFGECDLYTSLQHPLYRKLCMLTLRHGGFVVPVFWGPRWWAPLLPRSDVAVHTVVGAPVQLPRVPEPTNEEVALWHGRYVAAVRELFDTHKARFGYSERELEVM